MRGGREKYDRGAAVSLHAEEGVGVERKCKVERACAAFVHDEIVSEEV